MAAWSHRLLLVVPLARVNAVNTLIRNNFDPTGGNWLNPTGNLSATGAAPATHAWANFALTLAMVVNFVAWLKSFDASITLPANWASRTPRQKILWVASQVNNLLSLGLKARGMTNAGTWDDPDTAVAAIGLQRINTRN